MRNYINPVIETSYPDVFISKRKNRLRVYREDEIYLNDGDEFELEFDNSTRTIWLAKIKLNGEWVSEAGLVLRPGEHIFLDTPDLNSYDKKRFRFEIYEIEKGRSHLVEDNGLVEIFFHKQQQFTPHWLRPIPSRWVWMWTKPEYPQFYSGTSGTSGGYFRTSDGSFNCNISANVSANNMEETGRIERGSKSDQDFVNSYESFESYSSHDVVYKLLPLSKKLKTVQDIREYCSNCSRRRRKNENYCPSCGEKF